jgi:hypothetical protein
VILPRWFFVGLAFLSFGARLGAATPALMAEEAKINALLERVSTQSAVAFVRNGKTYDAATAAKFLRGKWERQKGEVATVQEFITKIASKSSTSGQPYRIRFQDGHEIDSAEFLTGLLTKPESSRPR